jgi:antitoxin Phd
MHTYTYSSARENLAKVLDEANSGEIVEITRRGSEPSVVISKAEFDTMRKALYDNAFEQIWNEHGESIKALTDR